jgi:hypothetical protein
VVTAIGASVWVHSMTPGDIVYFLAQGTGSCCACRPPWGALLYAGPADPAALT